MQRGCAVHPGRIEQSWGARGRSVLVFGGMGLHASAPVRGPVPAAAVEGILNLPEEKECVVIGTAYKEMKLKPNILDEYVKVPTPPHPTPPAHFAARHFCACAMCHGDQCRLGSMSLHWAPLFVSASAVTLERMRVSQSSHARPRPWARFTYHLAAVSGRAKLAVSSSSLPVQHRTLSMRLEGVNPAARACRSCGALRSQPWGHHEISRGPERSRQE